MLKYFILILVYIIPNVGFRAACYATHSSDNVDSLSQLIASQNDNTEKVDKLILLSQDYRSIDQDSALLFCDQALRLSRALAYREGRADALYKKSLIYKSLGELNTSLIFAFRYQELCDSLQDSMRLAKAYFHIGNLQRNLSNNSSVLPNYKKSLRIYREKKDTARMMAVNNSIGNYFQTIATYDSAAIYYHNAIKLYELSGCENGLGRILGNLAKVYLRLEEFENAGKYLNMSLKFYENHEAMANMAILYINLGNLANEKDDYVRAMEYYHQADSLYREAKDARGIHDVYLNCGIIYQKQGKHNLALKNYNLALTYYRKQNIAKGMITALQCKAWVYSSQEKFEQALILYDSSLQLAIVSTDLYRQQEILGSMLETYYDAGDFKNAFLFFSRYDIIKDSIFNRKKAEIISDLMFKYEKERDQAHILSLENENLSKEFRLQKRTNERNWYFFTGVGIIIIAFFAFIYFRTKVRKEKIIASQKIQQLEEEKKLLAARFLVEGQEEERKRIARELHDGLGVLLSATKMQFSAIRDKSPENKALIEKASKFLDQASGDVRKISHNMMPGLLTKLGLYEALEDLFDSLNDTRGLNAHIEIIGSKERLPENQEIMLYRIIQEMVNNTLKHADARRIELQINVRQKWLDIRYADDGVGFDVEEKQERKTLGLQTIQSRVKFLNGSLSIESSPAKGCVFIMQIPLS
ncbi:MAG: sensor histidine kinase [Bacteroidetes bacterium]|nr:sensor histidine kinase [Bacteroidota bacterium]